MTERLTERQRELMRHALGLSQKKESYRNYFAAAPGTDDFHEWVNMQLSGAAMRGRTINQPPNELVIFHVTEAGRRALEER